MNSYNHHYAIKGFNQSINQFICIQINKIILARQS